MSQAPPPFKAKTPTTFFQSVIYAWRGLIHAVVHQRNMRMHVVSAVLVGQVGAGIPLGLAEKVTLIFCVLMVLFAEMLNSALEQLVDLAIQQFDEKARLTKDAAAAGVLVLAIGTVVIFAAVLVHNADTILASGAAIQRQVIFGGPLAFLAGALMHEAKKPLLLDLAMFALALVILGYTVSFSESFVFSAMTFGMLVVCADAARTRQVERRLAAKANPGK